jgi:hypothetical protein
MPKLENSPCQILASILLYYAKPQSQGDGLLRTIKIRSTPSFGSDVKLEVPCREILRHVKELLNSHGNGQTKFSFPSPTSHSLQRRLGWQDRRTVLVAERDVSPDRKSDSAGGCIRDVCADRTALQYWWL